MAYKTRGAGHLFTAVVRRGTQRTFWRRVARAAVDYDFDKRSRLPSVSLEEIVARAPSVSVFQQRGVWGDTPLQDLVGLCALVAAAKPRLLFEFGTFTGNGTLHLLRNAPPDAHVHTLDLPKNTRAEMTELSWERGVDDDIVGSRFRGTPEAQRITQWFSDTRTFDTRPLENSVNFLWVDACHEYEFVKNDTEKSLKMAKGGAIIAWHDYSDACPGVVQYLHEISSRLPVTRIAGTQVAFAQL